MVQYTEHSAANCDARVSQLPGENSRTPCWVSAERSTVWAVEGQLTGVATLAAHLLALAVPIRGHRVELGGCGSHADRPGCIVRVNWVRILRHESGPWSAWQRCVEGCQDSSPGSLRAPAIPARKYTTMAALSCCRSKAGRSVEDIKNIYTYILVYRRSI